jgi:hypothetical protein
MTRPIEDVEIALQLSMLGASKRSIALRIGVSRTAVRDWLPDPQWAVTGREHGDTRSQCRATCLPLERSTQRAYSYLLGMYLGDGYIARHPRLVPAPHRVRSETSGDHAKRRGGHHDGGSSYGRAPPVDRLR